LASYRVLLLDGRVLSYAIQTSSVGDFRSNHRYLYTLLTRPVDPELLHLSERAAAAHSLRFTGLDFIKDEKTKQYLLLDVNPYPGISDLSKLYRRNLALPVLQSLLS
ncbi:MAG: hypothetical protein ACKOW9_00775, partial [Candidatus Paceibacterota bacterium]